MYEIIKKNIKRGLLLIAVALIQFLSELTLGRIFISPNFLTLFLVYMMVNRGQFWAVGGAFWAGIIIDGLLHQPLGVSSLALLVAIQAGRILLASFSSQNRLVFFITVATVTFITDISVLILASKPFLASFSWTWLAVIPRAFSTAVIAVIWLTITGGLFGTETKTTYEYQ